MARKAKGKVPPPATAQKPKAGGMSKMDAVREAVAKLGADARPIQIRDYAKQHLGIEMSADHASACKGKIIRQTPSKPAAKAAPQPLPAVAGASTVSATPPAPAAATPAVRTSPAKRKRKRRTRAVAKASAKIADNGRTKAESGIALNDILAVKDLVGRVGAGHLKSLIDAFSV
jgi:hypothetical protein